MKTPKWCIDAAKAIHANIDDRRGFDLCGIDDEIVEEWVETHAKIIEEFAELTGEQLLRRVTNGDMLSDYENNRLQSFVDEKRHSEGKLSQYGETCARCGYGIKAEGPFVRTDSGPIHPWCDAH